MSGGLTTRQREVFDLVAKGLSNDAIARELWITPSTVKFHLARIYASLGVSNRTEAARAWWALHRPTVWV